ncbi:hypothetical protein DFJ74DRAFT_654631 [Hyaloraphidium curvatum]|nr:hypothetical protein DFJ74DRAFT_654631 [Hyaloraphidium curvatum]
MSRPLPVQVLAGVAVVGTALAGMWAFVNSSAFTLKDGDEDKARDKANGNGAAAKQDVPPAPIRWTPVEEADPDRPFAIPPSAVASPLTTPSPPVIYVKAGNDVYRPRMSLSRLEPAEWLVVDSTYPFQMSERLRLLADPEKRQRCVAWVPGRDEAVRELLNAVTGFLSVRYPGLFRNEAAGLLKFVPSPGVPLEPREWTWDPQAEGSEHCLEILGQCAVEDFAILERRGRLRELGFAAPAKVPDFYDGDDEEYLVTASINCFSFPGPLLHNAVPGSLRKIHKSVPNSPPLMPHMERFFKTLKVDSPSRRWNCTFVDFSDMHRELRHEEEQGISKVAPVDADNAGERVFARTEAQTFVRLPVTGAVVFGIRTSMHQLGPLVESGGQEMAERLLRHVRSFDQPTKDYRRWNWIPAVEQWLEKKVASFGVGGA